MVCPHSDTGSEKQLKGSAERFRTPIKTDLEMFVQGWFLIYVKHSIIQGVFTLMITLEALRLTYFHLTNVEIKLRAKFTWLFGERGGAKTLDLTPSPVSLQQSSPKCSQGT